MSTPAATPMPADSAAPSPVTPATSATAAAQGLSPERLDQVISTTKPRGWIALIAVFAIVIVTLIWSIVATIPQQSSGIGVVSSLFYTQAITATTDGIFDETGITPGGKVSEGQVLGTITPFDGKPKVEVIAAAEGTIAFVGQPNGAGVRAGDQLAIIQISPDPVKGIVVVTYLPAEVATTFTPGESATVTVTNLAQSVSTPALATVKAVSSTPSTTESMTLQAGSDDTVSEWRKQAGGDAYRVILEISKSSNIPADLIPQAGQLVEIVNTFGSLHPIELLFGAK
jgi:hypothetical protein